MSRTQEQREAGRLRRERRSQRMAGDAMASMTSDSDSDSSSGMSARDEGYRNSLERNLGSEEYGRIGAEGLDDADNKGRYSAAEVKSEFRNSDKDVEGMTSYFQGLADEGSQFNKRARAFLESKGVTFGGDGGGDDDDGGDTNPPPVEEDPVVTPPPTDDGPDFPAPVVPGPYNPGGQTQIVNQDNDINQTIGDGSNVVNNVDNSVSQQSGGYSQANTFKNKFMKEYDFFK